MDKIVIAVDTLGGDNGCKYMMLGIKEAMDNYDDINIIVTGNEAEINEYIEEYSCDKTRIEIIPSTEEITCHDAPVEAIRRKRVDPEKEGYVHLVGIVLLLLLMVVVMFNDIRKLFI